MQSHQSTTGYTASRSPFDVGEPLENGIQPRVINADDRIRMVRTLTLFQCPCCL